MLSVILYIIGLSDNIQFILPIPVNYISDSRAFYGVLIYELVGLTVLTVIAFITFTTYLMLIQHACNQFSILMYVIIKKKKYIYIFICNRCICLQMYFKIELFQNENASAI